MTQDTNEYYAFACPYCLQQCCIRLRPDETATSRCKCNKRRVQVQWQDGKPVFTQAEAEKVTP